MKKSATSKQPLGLIGIIVLAAVICGPARAADNARRVPTVDDLQALQSPGRAEISPDGALIAYTLTETDLTKDSYLTHIWLAETATGKRFQLTRGDKSCSSPGWSPDGHWLAFTSDRAGDKSQVFIISPTGGEAIQLTKAENGVGDFGWSPDGRMLAFLAAEPESKTLKNRKDYLGDFDVVHKDYSYVQLWTVDVAEALKSPQPGRQRTKGTGFSLSSFSWSPDGGRIAFSATLNPDLIQGGTEDVYVLNLADDSVKKIVVQPGPDSSPHWSPDGGKILFSTYLGQTRFYPLVSRLAVVSPDGGPVRSLTDGFDEDPGFVAWTAQGIYFSALQKTASHLFRLDPATSQIERISAPDDFLGDSFSLSRDGKQLGFIAASAVSLSEVYVSGLPFKPRRLTDLNEQTKSLILGTREVITWKSKDGVDIEGVLIKPADFSPAKKYPLLCVIHGGPTGIDLPDLLESDRYVYPSDIWAARGALILKVNYRGSAGYGQKFRELNYRNLGVGDAWDVLSGVDYLIQKGWVDPGRMGCMGWSQGGYISAFLTTSCDRFKAVSVGAGISDWATYYYNTDITPFTVNYLGANPVDDPRIYLKTSPMSYIKKARTPTLIQHGELDRRVPIPNAYELRQGLEDRGVPVEMIVYKGFGHGIRKPKSRRAAMDHNLAWFNHYIFGDPKPDFANPSVPEKTDQPTGASTAPEAKKGLLLY